MLECSLGSWYNESPTDVSFDNVQVVHTRGRILEENHFYSYGLKIAAISSKAATSLQNKYGYQGDFSENDEETALDEFDLRHYDPQIGKWTTTDPYEQFASPYLGMGNSPVNLIDPSGGGVDDWIKYITKGGTKIVQWFDENFDEAKQIIADMGGRDAEDLGLIGLWQSTQNGIQNWLLNSHGSRTLLDGLFTGTVPKILDQLKEIPPLKSGFWKTFNFINDNITHNLSGKILSGIVNDAYITGQNYAQGHISSIRDLNGDYVSYNERLSAGINTFQLFMVPTDFAFTGITNTAKGGIEFADLSSLKPTHYLTRSKTQMKNLVNDIAANGIQEPLQYVQLNETKYIVGGNHRYFAAKRLGIRQVPVQQVKLPFAGYRTDFNLMLEGKMPGYWKYIK